MSQKCFLLFIKHSSNRDYWAIFLVTLLGILLSLFNEAELPLLINRAILGFITFFFSLGYLFIDVAFLNKKLEIYEKIGLSVGLSTILSPLILYIINFTPLKLTEIYIFIQYSIILMMGQKAPRPS